MNSAGSQAGENAEGNETGSGGDGWTADRAPVFSPRLQTAATATATATAATRLNCARGHALHAIAWRR